MFLLPIQTRAGWGRAFGAVLLVGAGGLGCRPPQAHLAAMPLKPFPEEVQAAQVCTVAVPREVALARALDFFVDRGFHIRAASPEAGQVNVFKQWDAESWAKGELSMEATFLFRAEGPQATRIRMVASGAWKGVSSSTKVSADVSERSAPQTPEDFKAFLDRLARAIQAPGS